MVGPGGINPMMMLMMAKMGQDRKTDPKLEEYLDKSGIMESHRQQLEVL